MARNFYLVLGVSRDADSSQIRKAHRRLVRLHHPDTGTGCVERFNEIQEAYETLADADSKRRYDQSLLSEHQARQTGAYHTRARPTGARRPFTPQAEPLIPRREKMRRRGFAEPEPGARRTQDSGRGFWSDIDEFLDGWLPGFFTSGRTASRRKDLYVELILEPEEARLGGLFPLKIPVREHCETCAATGYLGLLLCQSCRGRGIVNGHREMEISIPAHVPDGTQARLSLEDIGLNFVDLNVLVSIRGG